MRGLQASSLWTGRALSNGVQTQPAQRNGQCTSDQRQRVPSVVKERRRLGAQPCDQGRGPSAVRCCAAHLVSGFTVSARRGRSEPRWGADAELNHVVVGRRCAVLLSHVPSSLSNQDGGRCRSGAQVPCSRLIPSWRYQILGPVDIQAKCITHHNYVTRPDCN